MCVDVYDRDIEREREREGEGGELSKQGVFCFVFLP